MGLWLKGIKYATLGGSTTIGLLSIQGCTVTDAAKALLLFLLLSLGGGADEAEGGGADEADLALSSSSNLSDIFDTAKALEPIPAPGGLCEHNIHPTYTLTVINKGPDDANGVVLKDQLDGSMTFGGSSFPSCSYSGGPTLPTSEYTATQESSPSPLGALGTLYGGVVTCNLGTIASGQSVTGTIIVDIAPQTATMYITRTITFDNDAAVAGEEEDPNLDNNTASLSETFLEPVTCLGGNC